jgi:hypothetical protein
VAKRTIQRHIRAVRPPGDGQQWRVFLRNHTVYTPPELEFDRRQDSIQTGSQRTPSRVSVGGLRGRMIQVASTGRPHPSR